MKRINTFWGELTDNSAKKEAPGTMESAMGAPAKKDTSVNVSRTSFG